MPVFGLRRLSAAHTALLHAAAAAAGKAEAPVLVGGAVRDGWLARSSADLDIAVPAGALALAARVAARVRGTCVVLDAERGSARVIAGDLVLDVTDFRAPALEADLALRDFTVNALAVDLRRLLRDGRAPIIDPTGGLADLEARRLRPASPRVLADDPLRALRAIRFEATLGLRLTPAAARAVQAVAPSLAQTSAERVRDELVSLLGLPDTGRAFRRADTLGLLAVVFPEAQPMRATPQPAPHRFDVLEHSLRAVAGCDRLAARPRALAPFGDELAEHLAAPLGGQIDRRRALKLAALLHDVSKPETRRRIGGRIRFFEHDVLGARRARAIGERLRLPERVSALLERLVRHHLRPMHLAQAGEITRRARYRFYRDLADDTRDLLLLVLADSAAVTGVSPFAVWRQSTVVRDLLGGLAVEEQEAAAPPLLRGDDVMATFGLPPGPEVGRLLARAREAQGLGLVATREEALSFLDSPRDDP